MIEYLYDAIKATAGEDIAVNAKISQENGQPITQGCVLSLLDDMKEIAKVEGTYRDGAWNFNVPAELTKSLHGRYWYAIGTKNSSLSFKQPLYLV